MAEQADQRREAGHRTRNSLLAAVTGLLAQRDKAAVTLREVTESAGANVAAVSYHFGSLGALCDAAIEQALEQYLDAQSQALERLGSDATVDQLAAAFAEPMMRALAAGGHDLMVIRTVARAGIEPPPGWDRLAGKFGGTRRHALRVLAARVPGVDQEELVFRLRCAAGLLNWLAVAPVGADLATRSPAEIERLVVAVVSGALRGNAV
ncbi:TetR/AcrR family transcriptional regulator [Lentzea sp. NPDC059081]|uniref:TetR/AcrR family transcriptional regulator n=1 Tax=Lentzea sp. NPDC059081 TaxID=3346719 RepID=UPI0036B0A214